MLTIDNGNLALTFFETSAYLILLVLFLLLRRDAPGRFLRLWLAGWTLLTVSAGLQIVEVFQGSGVTRLLQAESFLLASLLLAASVLHYTGRSSPMAYLWALIALGGLSVVVGEIHTQPGNLAQWGSDLLQSGIFLVTGWILWRYAHVRRGHGAQLLAAALLLCGLNGLDRPNWSFQDIHLLRLALAGLFEVTLGIAMIVLVLEEGRARTEDLNEKLRRLTLITAASTQTFDVDRVMTQALEHLVGSLGASHGLVRLLVGEGTSTQLEIRAAVGYSAAYLQQHARVSAAVPWARKLLQQQTAFLSYQDERDPAVRASMAAGNLAALVLVRLPGKDAPLGVLGIGSIVPRRFEADEVNYLINVANLLGLTIQNIWLFNQAGAAERQWAYTFDSIADPILVHDPQFCILRANKALAARLGAAPESFLLHPIAEVFRQGEKSWSRCPYCEQAVGKGEAPDPTLGGYLLASTSEFRDAEGRRLGTVHVLKDITGGKRAEEKYRDLIENVQEGVFISTPEGRFLDFNDAFMRMLGYQSREELLAADIASSFYLHPGDRDRLKKLLLEHGSVADHEMQLRRKDGEIITVLESSFVTRDASGAVTAYQGFVLDITERKAAEQEVRRRNRELMVLNSIGQTLNQALPLSELLGRALRQVVDLFGVDLSAIYLLDEKTGAVRRLAAVGFRSSYARHFPAVSLPVELVQHVRAVRATILAAQGLPLPALFRDLRSKEGIEVVHIVFLWSKDRVIGMLSVASRTMREFSGAELNLLTSVGSQLGATIEKMQLHEETRVAYENLRRTQEQLLQSEKMAALGQLISGVAHELNNPLTAILGYGQLLSASNRLDPLGAEYIEKLYKQAQRTHRIVHNLLSFARQQKPERLPVKINQVLEDTLALREYDLKVNNIRLHRDLGDDLPATAADAHQLQQVFLNILNNSVDAILEKSDRGEIWVKTEMDGGRLLIEFADSGPGVHDPLRVFDPFYTTKPVGRGTGLGLSICYGIVSEHGGEITVRNLPPRGASFRISLPLMPVAESRPQVHAEQPVGPSDGRILLVDDEEAVLELEQEILNGNCHSVKAVRSGREAQEWLEQKPVDLVITDLKLPGDVTGRDLYEWICREIPALANRVVFTMSDARTDEVSELRKRSGCAFIQKPFRVEKFLAIVRQAMERAEAAQARR